MTTKKRKIIPRGAVVHVFQRASHGFVVFYSAKDSLVFFTIFCILVVRHKVRALGLCIMHNHVHILMEDTTTSKTTGFMRDLISWFTKVYNLRHGLSGNLFGIYGFSVKEGDKAIRTALAYVNNNPVEGRLCHRAEEWRWNFIAFAGSKHPYSEKMVLSRASAGLRRAVKKVEYFHAAERPLLYDRLDELMNPLSVMEKRQLVDFIIREYSCIDFPRAISFYGSYEKMLGAFSFNTGSDFDINEPYDPKSGQAYGRMTGYLAADKRFDGIGGIFRAPLEVRFEYFSELVSRCLVSPAHAKKFLHIGETAVEGKDKKLLTSKG